MALTPLRCSLPAQPADVLLPKRAHATHGRSARGFRLVIRRVSTLFMLHAARTQRVLVSRDLRKSTIGMRVRRNKHKRHRNKTQRPYISPAIRHLTHDSHRHSHSLRSSAFKCARSHHLSVVFLGYEYTTIPYHTACTTHVPQRSRIYTGARISQVYGTHKSEINNRAIARSRT